MKKNALALVVVLSILLPMADTYAQTENYKKGLKAIQANRYHEAMACFAKVVANEKFDITGKDLSMAYAYLAIIRTAYLEKGLVSDDFNSINQNQGQIQLAIQEMVRAVQFQDIGSKSLIKDSKTTLIELSKNAIELIGDSLLTFDETQPNESSTYLASFAVNQFGDLRQLMPDNWKLHDIIGLAYFHMGDKEEAMAQFKKGRELFLLLEEQPNSQLHLRNFILSGNYFFKEKNDMKEAYQISDEGSKYTSVLIHGLSDDQMGELLQLNRVENRFRQYMARIDESGQ